MTSALRALLTLHKEGGYGVRIDLDIYKAFVVLTSKHKQRSEVNFLGNGEKLSAVFSCYPLKYMLYEY